MRKVNVVLGFVSAIILAFSVAPRAAVATAPAGDPVNGKKVYEAQKCSLCHKIAGVGGALAGDYADLSAVGSIRDAVWLAKYLPAPKAIDPKKPPKLPMPPTKAKGKELDDLIAYLLTLKKK